MNTWNSAIKMWPSQNVLPDLGIISRLVGEQRGKRYLCLHLTRCGHLRNKGNLERVYSSTESLMNCLIATSEAMTFSIPLHLKIRYLSRVQRRRRRLTRVSWDAARKSITAFTKGRETTEVGKVEHRDRVNDSKYGKSQGVSSAGIRVHTLNTNGWNLRQKFKSERRSRDWTSASRMEISPPSVS